MKHSLPRILVGLYLLLVLSALAVALTSNTTFAALFLAIVTAPWSMLFVQLIDTLSPNWLNGSLGIILSCLGGLLNAALLYQIASRFSATRS